MAAAVLRRAVRLHRGAGRARPDCREPFFGGIRAAIERHGGTLEVVGAYILYLWTKDSGIDRASGVIV